MLVVEEAVEIRVLRRQGKSIREIARMLEVSRNTVRRYLRSEALSPYTRQARPSKLDPFKHYIGERVRAVVRIACRTTPQSSASAAIVIGPRTSAERILCHPRENGSICNPEKI